jgi:DNA polymerase III epsilon subunit family exonuclease
MNTLRGEKISNLEFCALDLETTGTNPVFHRIVEIGMIRFTLDGELDRFETLVNPEMDIPEKVEAIHGISNGMVASQPVIADLLHDIEAFMRGSILVVHNPDFDLSFLAGAFRSNNRPLPRMMALDTVRLSRYAYSDVANHKLDTLCNYLDIPLSHHRALSDAGGAMEVFKRAITDLDPRASWRLSHLLRFHGEMVKPRLPRRKTASLYYRTNFVMGKRVHIRYCDSEGKVTERDILPREIVRFGNTSYLVAFCYLRNNERYFSTKGILEVG